MIAGRTRKHPHHVIRGQSRNDLNLLKAGVIYGANASGKSNLIRAMEHARNLIVKGTRPKQPISPDRFKFKLDESCADQPTKFEFEFRSHGASYAYGFELSPRKIHTEWLYKIRKTDQTMIFERETTDSDEAVVTLGKIDFKDDADKQRIELTRIGTRPNQLFLTQSIENRVEQFEDVMFWFKRLSLIFPDTKAKGLGIISNQDSGVLVKFLQLFNTDISGLGFEKIDDFYNDVKELTPDMKDRLIEELEPDTITTIQSLSNNNHFMIQMNNDGDIEASKLRTKHLMPGTDEEVSFEMYEESDGTLRLMDLVPALISVLGGDRVYIIDELDRSLHPKLSRKFLELFLNHKKENLSQLIVTTHESSLLDLELLRRDEIWFVEKDKDGASSIYSLEEFKPGYDKDLRKGYLLGRFGAIPIVPRISDLGWRI
jgi:uncharacterized protein